jgi:hypothetical protein
MAKISPLEFYDLIKIQIVLAQFLIFNYSISTTEILWKYLISSTNRCLTWSTFPLDSLNTSSKSLVNGMPMHIFHIDTF